MSLQRRLPSTVVLGEEVRERKEREALMEEEKQRAEEKRFSIKSWWRRLVRKQSLLVEVAFAGREVVETESEARFRWRKRVVVPDKRTQTMRQEVARGSTRDSFVEEVAEVFTVHEVEEVFPDDFEVALGDTF